MTPAIKAAEKAKIIFEVHSYQHDANAASYGLEAVEKLNLAAEQVFKTLVLSLDNGQLVVAIVPVEHQVNVKMLAKAAGAKKAQMAKPEDVQRSSGYVLGGVSPLGQKKQLKTFLDSSAQAHDLIYVSAGRRGLEIALSPHDLLTLTRGKSCPLIQQ
ncbi:MAG: Cys-tRNA(Pro) deacylase [Colwelliaceae bacterium]|nr:Cys-tRNA(Pro) deacylase [Colwelliaceae bacterium]